MGRATKRSIADIKHTVTKGVDFCLGEETVLAENDFLGLNERHVRSQAEWLARVLLWKNSAKSARRRSSA